MKQTILPLLLSLLCTAAFADPMTTVITGVQQQDILNNIQQLTASTENLNAQEAQEKFKNHLQKIREALQPYGYYTPSMTPVSLTNKNKQWIATYHIDLGPPTRITKLDVRIIGEGRKNKAIQAVKEKLPLKIGDYLTVDNYDKEKNYLMGISRREGFLNPHFEKNVVVIQNNTAQVSLFFDTGPRYYFGPIHFNQSTFNDSFLERYVNFKPGTPYNSNTLNQLQQRYSQSNYFERVSYDQPLIDKKTPTTVPVNFNLEPKHNEDYSVGLGYGTATGPRATLGARFNHIGKNGHYITTSLRLSRIIQSFMAQYIIPGEDPTTDEYSLSSTVAKQTPQNDQSEYANVAIAYSNAMNHFRRILKLTLQHEKYSINQAPTLDSNLLIPSITFTRLRSDSLFNPTRGYQISLETRGSFKTSNSAVNFIQQKLSARALLDPTKNSKILLHGTLAWTKTSNLTQLPLSLRFFAGGPETLRGYSLDSIGPGIYLKLMGAEYQHRIVGRWFATSFMDAGTASDNFNATLNRSVGVGVVWYSEVGPIQFNVAKALNVQEKPYSFFIDLGAPL